MNAKFAVLTIMAMAVATPALGDNWKLPLPSGESQQPLPPGETKPTAVMLAKAQKVFPQEKASAPGYIGRLEYHFRKWGDQIWVCAYHWGANGGFCGRTTLSEVHQIDTLAEDECKHGGPAANIPHAMTGEAIWLDYVWRNGQMVRRPYWEVFSPDGYLLEGWKPLP